jgi:hypothetical protein
MLIAGIALVRQYINTKVLLPQIMQKNVRVHALRPIEGFLSSFDVNQLQECST